MWQAIDIVLKVLIIIGIGAAIILVVEVLGKLWERLFPNYDPYSTNNPTPTPVQRELSNVPAWGQTGEFPTNPKTGKQVAAAPTDERVQTQEVKSKSVQRREAEMAKPAPKKKTASGQKSKKAVK